MLNGAGVLVNKKIEYEYMTKVVHRRKAPYIVFFIVSLLSGLVEEGIISGKMLVLYFLIKLTHINIAFLNF